MQFSRERSTTHPGAIGFGNANDFLDFLRCNAQSSTNTSRNGIGGSNKWECSKINIQHAALGAFSEYFFPFPDFFVDEIFTIDNLQAAHEFNGLEKFFFPLTDILIEPKRIQQSLVLHPEFDILCCKILVEQISYPQTVPACFVHVCRTYSFQGGTNLLIAFRKLRSLV